MDKILLRYTEYNESHKPLTNGDYGKIYHKRGDKGEGEGDLKEESSSHEQEETMTEVSGQLDNLTPRTVAQLSNFMNVNGMRTGATPTAYGAPHFIPFSPMKSPYPNAFGPASTPTTPDATNLVGSPGLSISPYSSPSPSSFGSPHPSPYPATPNSGESSGNEHPAKSPKKFKKKDLKVTIPDKSFPAPMPISSTAPPEGKSGPPGSGNLVTPASASGYVYYPIQLTPSLNLDISTPSGFGWPTSGWTPTSLKQPYLPSTPDSSGLSSGESGGRTPTSDEIGKLFAPQNSPTSRKRKSDEMEPDFIARGSMTPTGPPLLRTLSEIKEQPIEDLANPKSDEKSVQVAKTCSL